jgi:hypothetical protein
MKAFKCSLFFFVMLLLCNGFAYAQGGNPSADSTVSMDPADICILQKGIQYGMQSSYDRTGGNDDGHGGVIRVENHNSVLAEIAGAGTITRIWFPMEAGNPEEPIGLRGKRIYIYLDGNTRPVIDMPVLEMFNNTNRQFPFPLCGMGLGGCWCYLPISFNNGAKVVVEGETPQYFQVEYNTYDKSRFKTFKLSSAPSFKGYQHLKDIFWHMGDIAKLTKPGTIVSAHTYTLKSGANDLPFIKGPAVLRGITIKGSPENLEAFLNGSISIKWDGAVQQAINTPLSLFFMREKGGLAGKSIYAGTIHGGGGVYNFYPMPYQNGASAKLNMPKACKVEITCVFEKTTSIAGMGYLHIHHQKDYPTTPGKMHLFVDADGEGQYAGTYMRAIGKSLRDTANGYGIIYWTGCLEGDEIFNVDGKMVENGTGTEDFFNAGYNGMPQRLDCPGLYPMHGFTLFDAGADSSSVAAYRWRMTDDMIPFKKHFHAAIEVGPTDNNQGNYESISYYYLRSPGSKQLPKEKKK